MRPSSAQQHAALKAAFRQAMKLAGGGDSFTHATRVSPAQLSRYCAPQYPDFVPADVILDIDLEIGEPVMTAALARLQGWRLVAEDRGGSGGHEVMERTAADMVRDSASAFSSIHAALADGKLTAGERREILDHVGKLQAEMMTLLRALAGGETRGEERRSRDRDEKTRGEEGRRPDPEESNE